MKMGIVILESPDECIMLWSDDRIEIKIPNGLSNDRVPYFIRVVAAGRITEKTKEPNLKEILT